LGEILREHGWKLLGTGAEAAVAAHPSKPYVLKIFKNSSRYNHFVKFVDHYPSNPHLPKFSRYVRPVPGTGFNYVRMEKLEKVDHDQLLKEYHSYLLMMLEVGEHARFQTLGDDLTFDVEEFLKESSLDSKETKQLVYQKIGGAPPQTWTELIKDLVIYSKQRGVKEWDMHAANFMRRDKTLVITDPFY
jgi:hypothetical protein